MVNKKTWMQRHLKDPYVKAAQKAGYASRAAFKLRAIQEKDRLLKKGMTVVDLGAAPGGWSQVVIECVGEQGRVIAIDLLPMDVPAGVTFIQGDFNDPAILSALLETAPQVDVILSDMAPNLSGQKSIDLPRTIHLLELALDCAIQCLKPKGSFLFKAFQGAGLEAFVQHVKLSFSQVKYRKPGASRAESKEIYILATNFHHRGS